MKTPFSSITRYDYGEKQSLQQKCEQTLEDFEPFFIVKVHNTTKLAS